MMPALLITLFFLTPATVLWLAAKQSWAHKLGVIVICYVAGMIMGNTGLIPAAAAPVQSQVADVAIALGMPMLLFTLDVRSWRHIAGKALLSMLLATSAVVTTATALFALLRQGDGESASHFAAMSVGVYTGGTPNLAAIKSGLAIPHSEYIVFHSLDTLVGSAYLLAMLTLGIRLFRRCLPGTAQPPSPETATTPAPQADSDDYSALLQRSAWPQVLAAMTLSALVVAAAWGCAIGYARLEGKPVNSAIVIVALTTLGILLSLLPRVRRLEVSYRVGMYLIYVFCFAVASMARFDQLLAVDLEIAVFLLGTVFGSLLLHCLACRLCGVDGDTFMVTSVAAVCSPPFVPMMARALGNPSMILSGMTTGIIGYALGNYLGISLGLWLQSW